MPVPDDQKDRVCLGNAVRSMRARRHLTQEDLSYAAGLGRHFVGSLERGEAWPRFNHLLAVSRALDVQLSELVLLFERLRHETGGRG